MLHQRATATHAPRHNISLICPVCRSALNIGKQCSCGFLPGDVGGVPVLRTLEAGESVDFLSQTDTLPVQDSAKLTIEPIVEAFNQGGDGLILELGAGVDVSDHPRLVKTDAFAYSTLLDYVVDAHAMPFPDNTFDFVFSLAVFEHLHSPWIAAKEIFRVLRPGGKVYVLTAFMQHLHGYPHHYFNMTTAGAERIFSDFEIIESRPSKFCPLDQLAVILLDVHQMAGRLSYNKTAGLLARSIEDFCHALPPVQSELVAVPENLEAWRRIAPGIELLAMKPVL